MKYYKKIISLILAILIMLMNVSYAYASTENDSMSNHIKEMFLENLAETEEIYHRVVNTIQNANNLGDDLDYMFRALALSVGIIVSGSYFITVNTIDSGIGQIIDGWDELTDQQKRNKLGETLTDDIEITDDEIILGPDANLILKYYINQLINSNKYYKAYTLDLQRYSYSGWWTEDLKNLIQEYQENYWVVVGSNGGSQSTWYYHFIKKNKVGAIYNDVNGLYMYKAKFINSVTFTEFLADSDDEFYYAKSWNGSLSQRYNLTTAYRFTFCPPTTGTSNVMYTKFVNQNKQFINSEISIGASANNLFTVSYGKRYPITLYSSDSLFSSVSRNESPYYVSNKYSDFANSSGTYTIDSNNSNVVKYGDIVTYNNNYYENNGQYPTMPQIDIYINDNDPDATPPNNGGGEGGQGGQGGEGGQGGAGGSGGNATVTNTNNPTFNNNPSININLGLPSTSSNSVSGNGIPSGGVGNIFTFLSQIGDILGDLIKNIGKVLADILEGIVSVVSDLVEAIPTVFSDFMGALLGWLPVELRALITLSITAMIIVGLIKLFRG